MDNTKTLLAQLRADKYIPEEEYNKLDCYLKTLDALYPLTYKGLYLIDCFNRKFMYVSDSPFFLHGLLVEDVKRLGYTFFVKYVYENDLALLEAVNYAGIRFLENMPVQNRYEYSISCDIRMRHKDSREINLINHKLTPLAYSLDGKLWLTLGIASISPLKKPGNIEMFRTKNNTFWRYNITKERWEEKQIVKLTKREKHILQLSAQGYTINDIADIICKSINSVKLSRGQLFKKLKVTNITEAILYATNKRLL